MSADKLYYLAMRAMIRDGQGRVLLLRRSQANKGFVGWWELPGGKADEGELFEQTVRREVREETGLEIALGGVLGAYGLEMTDKRIAVLCLHAEVVGGTLTLSEEHDAYAWVDADKIGDYQLVSGLKELIETNL